ncbi:hypothetical protein HYT02_05105, partial [Candidatus Gottesmanbacteria bacterium]|nr:hypothetical protein [Candidatus Gottesmanbacteria bacterium]
MKSKQEDIEFVKVEKKNSNLLFSIYLLIIFVVTFLGGYLLQSWKNSKSQNLVTPGSVESTQLNEYINP